MGDTPEFADQETTNAVFKYIYEHTTQAQWTQIVTSIREIYDSGVYALSGRDIIAIVQSVMVNDVEELTISDLEKLAEGNKS